MTDLLRRHRLLTALLAAVLVLVWGYLAATSSGGSGTSGSAAPTGHTSSATVAERDLPAEALDTLRLIDRGGPFPYPRSDGVVFGNRERSLPDQPSGYYHEYTVVTPGSPDRGARRIVTGQHGEFYYTDDHYRTFRRILR